MASGRLTPAGERFAAGMRHTLEAMLAERVPAPVAGAARDALTRDHGAWRRRHSRVS
jgi:hypothetical protein